MRVSGQKSTFCGGIGVEREEADTCWSKRASHPVSERYGELNRAFRVQSTNFPGPAFP